MASQIRPAPSQMHFPSASPTDEEQSMVNTPVLKVDLNKTWSREVALMAAIPALVTVVISGGVATTLLVWIYTHAVVDSPRQTLAAIWRAGYVLTNEGSEVVNGLEKATSNALTISAATSATIPFTVPFVSAIIAFRIASQFLELSAIADHRAETSGLPTPLQFGFLLRLFQAGSIPAIGSTFAYMAKKGLRRAPISPLLIRATVLMTFTYLLTSGVALSDFFLHKNTSTVKYLLKNPATSPFPYGRAFNASLCYNGVGNSTFDGSQPNAPLDGNSTNQYLGCNMSPVHVWAHIEGHLPECGDLLAKSYNTVTNTSAITRGFLAAPQLSLAAANTSNFSTDGRSTFSATSIAVSIDCKVVKDCAWNNVTDTVTGCTGVGSPIDATTPTIFGGPLYDGYGAIPNPFQFSYRFRMDVQMVGPTSSFPDNRTYYERNHFLESVATCNASVSDVSLTWFNLSYAIDSSTLSSGFVAGAIFGPTVQTVMPSHLAATIEGMALNADALSDYEAGLSNILADGMVNRASPLLSAIDTTAASTFSTLLVTQYPIVPLSTFILLLYIYTILIVSLLTTTVLTRSSHIVVERVSGEPKRVSTLALAHRNLMNPLSTIAVMLAKDHGAMVDEDHAAAVVHAWASIAMKDSRLFEPSEKATTDPPRVVVGLDEETGIQPMFGWWLKGASKTSYTPSLDLGVSKDLPR